MSLSTILLGCAIVAGILGGAAARYRRHGSTLVDLAVGLMAGVLFAIVAAVVLVLAAGLDFFGLVHLVYLMLVVGIPIAIGIVVLPHLLDAEFRAPIRAWFLSFVALAAIGIGVWSTHIEPTRLTLDTQILGATGADQPIVVGVIADLQTSSIGSHERSALDTVVGQDPDVVVIPGDLFQIEPEDVTERLPEFLGWLRDLTREVDHVILVNGNVDDGAVLADFATESGAHYLANEVLELDVNGQDIVFAGLELPDQDLPQSYIDPEVTATLAEATNDDDLVIMVTHYPDAVLDLSAASTVDLVVAGHTHGGQVAIPGFGPPLTLSGVPREVAGGGLHVVNGHPIYVSTGVGLERGQAPQLRFGVRPSVAVLTIVPA